jgi:hypothetical protein
MQVHWGSLDLEGEAGVESGFLFVFTLFCFEGGSSFNEYDEEAFRENLNEGDCNKHLVSIHMIFV